MLPKSRPGDVSWEVDAWRGDGERTSVSLMTRTRLPENLIAAYLVWHIESEETMSSETAKPGTELVISSLCLFAAVLAFATGLICDSENRVSSLIEDLGGQSCARKIWAVQTLGALKDPAAIDALRNALYDPEPSVRRGSAWALGQINDRRAVHALISATKHWDDKVRKEAAASLSKRVGYLSTLEMLALYLE